MTHRTGSLVTGDGLTLFTQSWTPEVPPRASVVLAHGYSEHSGRYSFLAEALNAAGLQLVAFDFRGHGRSEGRPGLFVSYGQLADDLRRVVEEVRQDSPGLPLVLMGHSVGGVVATLLAVEHPQLLDALVLSSPYLRPTRPPGAGFVQLVKVLASLWPGMPTQRIDSADISRDPDQVRAYERDPLVNRNRIAARVGLELVLGGARVAARAAAIEHPLLVIHGGSDRIADPDSSRALIARVASEDKTLLLYPDSYHEVLNDLNRDQAVSGIVEWLEAGIDKIRSGA